MCKSQRAISSLLLTLLAFAPVAFSQHYTQTDLTADVASVAPVPNLDPDLVNAWGLTRASGSFWWISDNGTGLSSLLDGMGVPQSLVVTIPPPKGKEGPSAPTGTVFNFTNRFNVEPGAKAIFIFVTEDGTISGWNPTVNLTSAVLKVNRPNDAIYKGVAIAQTGRTARLYASNFMSGRVDVFDGGWHLLDLGPNAFVDPILPPDYAPFGIQNVGGNIVVTFAHRPPGAKDEDHGPGLGYVTIFDTDGHVIQRLAHGNYFNAPWGITLAPADFGVFSHRLIIGNFGNGGIHAFDPITGKLAGTLLDESGNELLIDGLWALEFGGGTANSGPANAMFFTAGPDDESHGLFGMLTAIPSEQRGSSE